MSDPNPLPRCGFLTLYLCLYPTCYLFTNFFTLRRDIVPDRDIASCADQPIYWGSTIHSAALRKRDSVNPEYLGLPSGFIESLKLACSFPYDPTNPDNDLSIDGVTGSVIQMPDHGQFDCNNTLPGLCPLSENDRISTYTSSSSSMYISTESVSVSMFNTSVTQSSVTTTSALSSISDTVSPTAPSGYSGSLSSSESDVSATSMTSFSWTLSSSSPGSSSSVSPSTSGRVGTVGGFFPNSSISTTSSIPNVTRSTTTRPQTVTANLAKKDLDMPHADSFVVVAVGWLFALLII
ncbi:hypothetical protein V1517DRAFT_334111 [Lipomyces orientalis]|uniref:Uncharacterized protein n=1 Tax=Lipomyces orientalis TaxID=1233043 RepID=A0ACC3TFR3_9ASCO